MFAPPPPEFDQRRQAKFLYWMGWGLADIADFLEMKSDSTVRSWKLRDKWDEASSQVRCEGALEARFIGLVTKAVKTGGDFKEIDLLGRQIERLARIRRYEGEGGHEGDLNPKVANRNAGPKKKAVRNHFDDEAIERLEAVFLEGMFGYQHTWWDSSSLRTRVLLKSRQIGATYYFAREALLTAVKTGRNQIFLSASKNQAHVFRQYIVAMAHDAGVELTGDPIELSNGAKLYFLGTNARTAQGYHGDFYFDEFFWTFRFRELNKVASGMATHKQFRKTYFSTPSSIQHEAYEFWTGEDKNKRRAKDQRRTLDVLHETLKGGRLCEDRRWRQIVTVEDAEEAGCDLFDIEELREEYSPEDFANLFLCEFVDDSQSVFPLKMMEPCHVEAFDWEDFNEMKPRPFGNRPVWVGYDPSSTGDSAALVIVAPPASGQAGKGAFRVLAKRQFRGMDFTEQAAEIQKVCQRYNVQYIGIDATGLGVGVLQLVKQFFPGVRALNYTPELKMQMVLKASDTIRRLRLHYDAAWRDVTAAFMSIKRVLTNSGRAVTYDAGRSEESGHADLAWAIMHTLIHEPLEAVTGGGKAGFMEIYD